MVWSQKWLKLFVQNRSRLLVRRWRSGHSFFCLCDSAVRCLDSEIQANVDYCYVRRRAECTSLSPGLKHPSLRSDSCLAAKRRAFTCFFFFNKASEPNMMSCCSVCTCVLSHDPYQVATNDARWVRCSPCSLGRARVDRQPAVVWLR